MPLSLQDRLIFMGRPFLRPQRSALCASSAIMPGYMARCGGMDMTTKRREPTARFPQPSASRFRPQAQQPPSQLGASAPPHSQAAGTSVGCSCTCLRDIDWVISLFVKCLR
ncbi:hypothetical protein CKAH01_06023 [Colletotrichum kahawae]|uniref:Uncharacterized protein n=1 Tax=Colletotrichum kahawae TaxID=34407 RepID=A0AAE0D4Q8_COLKA|nr:hypothetical protein CKAH01_06023 [Colletotrichum kahawae]